MIHILATALPALFFSSAPALLLARWFSPKWFSWLTVVLLACCLGWVLLIANEHVQDADYEQCVERRFQRAVDGMTEKPDPECPFLFVHNAHTYNLELGWLWTLLYLSPWLALYGIAQLFRKRMRGAKLS